LVAVEFQTLIGDDSDNTIIGTPGNDDIQGLGGNDTINAGLGVDNVDGGTGNDLLIVDYSSNLYTGSSSGLSSVVLRNGIGEVFGYYSALNSDTDSDKVTFSNIERFQITGTGANDNIRTGDGDDVINGGGGDDIIDPQ
jgi:Ca2+-binding RTX toxin-like protein